MFLLGLQAAAWRVPFLPTRVGLGSDVMRLNPALRTVRGDRHTVVVRRTQYELDKALEREHILEGLKIAVDNIDEVIKLIRKAKDTPVASESMSSRFSLA